MGVYVDKVVKKDIILYVTCALRLQDINRVNCEIRVGRNND